MRKTLLTLCTVACIAVPLGAQTNQRRASISGAGNPNQGKCTLEVVVDGAAEVEIRGDSGVLRNTAGQPPQWRRFECTAKMPDNPFDFQVRGIDGRGRVTMLRDPRNGGAAVLRIEDPSGGAEAYTVDLLWSAGQGSYNNGPRRDAINQPDRTNPGLAPGLAPGFAADRAVRVCEEGVRRQAVERFGTPDIRFRGTNLDDRPDRRDWVAGAFAVRGRDGRDETYRFSCSVDLADGRVRSVQIDPARSDSYSGRPEDRYRSSRNPAVDTCQGAIESRLERSGYNFLEFDRINMDADRVVGNARGDRGGRSDRFDFSCRMNLNTGAVRSMTLTKR